MRRFVVFLVRKKLGLKKRELFRFTNQLSNTCVYYFTETHLMKRYHTAKWGWHTKTSGASLNWLLDDECEIEKVPMSELERIETETLTKESD